MLQQKREEFRVSIRNRSHQELFEKKRTINLKDTDSIELQYSFEDLIESIKNPQIFCDENLKLLNKLLLYQIKSGITNQQLLALESIIDHFISILLYQLWVKEQCIVPILTILINLTYISDRIGESLLCNYYLEEQITITQIISSYLQRRIEIKINLELLLNLWGNHASHQLGQFDLFITLRDLIQENNSENQVLIQICKCIKNLIQSFMDVYSPTDYHFLLLVIKQLLTLSLDRVEILSPALECYGSMVQIFNLEYIEQDQQIILQLLQKSLQNHDVIEQIIRMLCYLFVNESEQFNQILIKEVVEFIKSIFRIQINNQMPNVIHFLQLIFDQQEQIFILYSFYLVVFYDDAVIIKDIINFIGDQYPKKIRETAIRSIKILTENSNELQIQMLMNLDLYTIAIDLLKDNGLSQLDILQLLQIAHNIIRVFNIQTSQIDYPYHLQSLALSKNLEICKEANDILQYFEELGIMY